MNKDTWVSRRFWFGFGSILFGALVTAFAGDPDVVPWLVKIFGACASTCGGAVMLLQHGEIKAKNGASGEHKAL